MSRTERHIPGEPGLWLLIFGEMAVFAGLFAVFLVQRASHLAVFVDSHAKMERGFGVLNTVVLLTSSLLVVLAVRSVKGPDRRLARPLLTGAIGLSVVFVVVKVLEYHDKISSGLGPQTNEFSMYYFTLTGLHLAHVVAGMAVLLILRSLARKPQLSDGQFRLFEGGACYWHMVDMVWIVIFALVYLVR